MIAHPYSAYRPAAPIRSEGRLTASGTLGAILAALAAILAVALPGCSSSSAHSVQPDRARVALETALDAWKQGQSLEAFERSGSSMVVQDLDWSAGAKLVGHQLLDDGQPADANLRVNVRLTLEKKGKPVEKTVRYLVTTSPSVTIFRDVMW